MVVYALVAVYSSHGMGQVGEKLDHKAGTLEARVGRTRCTVEVNQAPSGHCPIVISVKSKRATVRSIPHLNAHGIPMIPEIPQPYLRPLPPLVPSVGLRLIPPKNELDARFKIATTARTWSNILLGFIPAVLVGWEIWRNG